MNYLKHDDRSVFFRPSTSFHRAGVAFAIAAFIAGLGGALLAYQQQTVTFDAFSALSSLVLFGTVYLAGTTSVSGGLLAGAGFDKHFLQKRGILKLSCRRWPSR